ncbi:MAG TPA: SIMPL domain-containing protein [Mariprofundaceae bacterium]|nr:SIMPL domain-containing protein [Mariprofundaceae bacterium]
MYRALFSALLLLVSLPAMAEEPKGTQVSLSATAEEMLPNDEVVVRFRIEAEGPKADALRQQVNRVSQAVDERLGREKDLVQQTTDRRIEPIWHYDSVSRRQVKDGWRLVQSEQVTSTRLDAVPDWLDGIERAGAHLDGLVFRTSRQTENAAQDRLRLQAVSEFRARAAVTAKALGASSFRILHLNTNSQMPGPVMPMMAMARAGNAPEPALAAGESRLSVTVSGDILLPEKDYPVK